MFRSLSFHNFILHDFLFQNSIRTQKIFKKVPLRSAPKPPTDLWIEHAMADVLSSTIKSESSFPTPVSSQIIKPTIPTIPTIAPLATSIKSLSTKIEAVHVAIRCRPLTEIEQNAHEQNIVTVTSKIGQVKVQKSQIHTNEMKMFTFDYAFAPHTPQNEVFERTTVPLLKSVLEGYNATVLAYGQTGTGKTFTMEGKIEHVEEQGIMPQAFTYIFNAIEGAQKNVEFLVRMSFCEIYMDDVFDLLSKTPRAKVDIKESKERGVFVKDLSVFNVKNVNDMMKVLKVGQKSRTVGATKMNEGSSRSHSILTVTIETSTKDDKRTTYKVGKLNLVDLAGSERQKKTGSEGVRLDEAKAINWSLTVLGNCIKALIDPNSKHVPYRDSKLTRILQDSLGGNTKTVMIANIGPAASNYDETVSTLRYADRAKQIKNKPTINEDPKDAMLRGMQEEIARLKAELAARMNGDTGSVTMTPELMSLLQRAESGVVTIYDNGKGDGETMFDPSQLPAELVENRIIENIIVQDTGLTEAELKKHQERHREMLEALKAEKEKEKQREHEQIALGEQTAQHLQQTLQEKESSLAKEQTALTTLQRLIAEREQQLLVGGEQLDIAAQQKLELKRTEDELRLRLEQQERLKQELADAEEAELFMHQHHANTQDELQKKTDKLKRLWSKYQERKADLDEVQQEFALEREDLVDTIRDLDRQLKLKNLLLTSFIPHHYASLIESHAAYDTINDQWMIDGVEFAGNNINRFLPDQAVRRRAAALMQYQKDLDKSHTFEQKPVYLSYSDFRNSSSASARTSSESSRRRKA